MKVRRLALVAPVVVLLAMVTAIPLLVPAHAQVPVLDNSWTNCVNLPTGVTTYTQPITTTVPNALALFIAQFNVQDVSISSSNVNWNGPIFLQGNGNPMLFWSDIPLPGTYQVTVTMGFTDHFKLLGADFSGANLTSPFDGGIQKADLYQGSTFIAPVVTTLPNDLVLGYMTETASAGSLITTISPFSMVVNASADCYSQAVALASAVYASPTNQPSVSIMSSSTSEQMFGSTFALKATGTVTTSSSSYSTTSSTSSSISTPTSSTCTGCPFTVMMNGTKIAGGPFNCP